MSLGWHALIPARRWGRSVTKDTLRADLIAGFTNATIVLPQAVAFATIAGLPPEYGLYTAMVTPIIAALFGSSMVMISGPTTAISAVVFSTVSGLHVPGSEAFIQMVLLLTLLVGLIQFALGYAGIGRLVAFVSHSVMLGFTAAAAVLIAASQLADALGVDTERGGSVFTRIVRTFDVVDTANWRAIVIAATALIVAAAVKYFAKHAPNFIVGLAVASVLAYFLDATSHGVKMVGALPSVVPSLTVPEVNLNTLAISVEGAFAIALIGLLEAISIGRAFAFKSGGRFDADQEIVGQGMSNIVGSFFQAYPGSGSFTRSGVNYEAGAQTPMSAIAASVFLFLLLLLLAPLAASIPIPALAGIILLVAYKLISFEEIKTITQSSRAEMAIILATFLAGLLVKLEFAIYVGVILSLLIFLSKSSRPTLAISAPDKDGVFRNAQVFGIDQCPQAVFTRLDGALYFGSVEAIERAFRRIEQQNPLQKHMVLVLKGVGDIDMPGGMCIVEEARRRRRRGGGLYIVARYPPLMTQLKKLGVTDGIGGEQMIYANKGDAVAGVLDRLDGPPCATCEKRIFMECALRPGGSGEMIPRTPAKSHQDIELDETITPDADSRQAD